MEKILNLNHLEDIHALKPFFGEIRLIKDGKYYHMRGDHNLNHADYGKFTKRPKFTNMGNVIYAGLNRICKLTQKMPSDFAVRVVQPNPTLGIVSVELILGRGAVLKPDTLVPAIWIQYNLKTPKYAKFSLLMYRIQCANGQMVHFDGFMNEKTPIDNLNHIHHQWSPCYYNALFYSFDDALAVMRDRPISRRQISDRLMRVFRIGKTENKQDLRHFGSQDERYAMELDRILEHHIERYGETEYAMLQAATFFASHVEPEMSRDLPFAQRFDAMERYRERRMNQAGRLMTQLEIQSRKYQSRKQLKNREWEELFNFKPSVKTW